MVETINKLVRVQRQLLQDLGRDPTPEEIGAEMDMSADRVREIQKISQEPVSLETPIGEEEDSQLGDFIEDSQAVVPPDAASFSHAAGAAHRRCSIRSPIASARLSSCASASSTAIPARSRRSARVWRHARAHPPDRVQDAAPSSATRAAASKLKDYIES